MSLGAMTTADITVKILPCGLNYYRVDLHINTAPF